MENDVAEERTLTLSQQRELSESNTIYAADPHKDLKLAALCTCGSRGEDGVKIKALSETLLRRTSIPSFTLPSLTSAHHLPWQVAKGFSFGESKVSVWAKDTWHSLRHLTEKDLTLNVESPSSLEPLSILNIDLYTLGRKDLFLRNLNN